jgi:hypothetical protein
VVPEAALHPHRLRPRVAAAIVLATLKVTRTIKKHPWQPETWNSGLRRWEYGDLEHPYIGEGVREYFVPGEPEDDKSPEVLLGRFRTLEKAQTFAEKLVGTNSLGSNNHAKGKAKEAERRFVAQGVDPDSKD